MPEHMPLRGGTACACGWNYGLSLNDTRSDMGLFLEHHRRVVAEEIAQAIMAERKKSESVLMAGMERGARIAREVGNA